MPKYACLQCGEISSERLCPRHAAAKASRLKDKERLRGSASARGYGHKWRKTRALFLKDNPHCALCGELATDVHHLDGKGPHGELGHEPANLQALCHSHHSSITASR